VCVCVWTFSLTTIKRYTCAHYTPVLRQNFLLTPFVLTLFWGSWLRCSMWTDAALFVLFLVLVTIFGSNARPMTSYPDQIPMLFNLGIGMPRGTFRFIACYRNLSDHITKFLCSPYQRYYNLINSALHHYHPNALHQLFYSKVWLESWISILMRPTWALNQHPSRTSCSVNTGVPDFDHHTRDITLLAIVALARSAHSLNYWPICFKP